MKLNIIIACIMLWSAVEFVAIIVSTIHRITLKQEHISKKKYLLRVIELASMDMEDTDIIRELYYSFVKDKRLRIVLLQALRGSTEKAFAHINAKLGCEPMKKVHSILIKKIIERRSGVAQKGSQPLISNKTKEYLLNDVNNWDSNWNSKLKTLKKKKATIFIEKLFAHLINLWLYLELQTNLCLQIYVLVNTLGVIMYIIIDYECCVVDEKIVEGKLSFYRYEKKISQTFARGIENIYQLAASLGLIINITTVVMSWLGPVA